MFRAMAVLALSFAGLSCAQEQKTTDKVPEPAQRKRLASVTWDLSRHRLVWVVEKGTVDGEEFQVAGSDRYEISPDEAIMEFDAEKRGFTEAEAVSLVRLLNTLSLYCAESVVWWEQGQGTQVGPKGDEPKGEKVERKNQKRREARPDEMVAGLRWAIARTLQ